VSCQRTEDSLTGRTRSFHCNGTKALTSVRFTVPLQQRQVLQCPRREATKTPQPASWLPQSKDTRQSDLLRVAHAQNARGYHKLQGFALGINQAKAMLMINHRESRFLVLWWWDASEAK